MGQYRHNELSNSAYPMVDQPQLKLTILVFIPEDLLLKFLDRPSFNKNIVYEYGDCIHKIYRKKEDRTDSCIDIDPYSNTCKRGK